MILGDFCRTLPPPPPPKLLSLLPQLIDLTDAARVQRGEDGISQSENFFMQEKQLKKCGNGNTNRNLVFERIKCAETDVYKKKGGGVFASICMLRVYSLNYFLHFAQV